MINCTWKNTAYVHNLSKGPYWWAWWDFLSELPPFCKMYHECPRGKYNGFFENELILGQPLLFITWTVMAFWCREHVIKYMHYCGLYLL